MINIFLAEDHKILRDGLKSILLTEPDINIVGEADNGKEAVRKIPGLDIDILIVDVNMPFKDGIETTKYLRKHYPAIKVIGLSMIDNERTMCQMMEAGAKSYLLKSIDSSELLYAIKRVYNGGTYICSEMSLNLIGRPKKVPKPKDSIVLTKREIEIVQLISDGFTNMEIADKLYASPRTIETHRTKVLEKTKAKNSVALVKYALSKGIIS